MQYVNNVNSLMCSCIYSQERNNSDSQQLFYQLSHSQVVAHQKKRGGGGAAQFCQPYKNRMSVLDGMSRCIWEWN